MRQKAISYQFYPLSLYSKTSPGWHSNTLQIASRVDSRTALALPFFKTEMLAIVMPTFPASSVTLTIRWWKHRRSGHVPTFDYQAALDWALHNQ
jgi:hypothetical protein